MRGHTRLWGKSSSSRQRCPGLLRILLRSMAQPRYVLTNRPQVLLEHWGSFLTLNFSPSAAAALTGIRDSLGTALCPGTAPLNAGIADTALKLCKVPQEQDRGLVPHSQALSCGKQQSDVRKPTICSGLSIHFHLAGVCQSPQTQIAALKPLSSCLQCRAGRGQRLFSIKKKKETRKRLPKCLAFVLLSYNK